MQVLNLTSLESAFLQTKLDQTGIDYIVTPSGLEVLNPSKAAESLIEELLIQCVVQQMQRVA